MSSYIQITQLPTLQEFQHEDREPNVIKVLAKSIALQLKPMNAQITQFAFERLLQLADGQLNDMISQLHRMSNLQRRETVAKGDVSMLMRGFNLSPSSIELQSQISQYYSQKYPEEFNRIHSFQDLPPTLTNEMIPFEDHEAIKQNVSTVLVPPTNPLQSFLPNWLPDFPPDHTYKFTPQYSHPITDETTIRRQIVEEGKQSELALSHLSQKKNTTDEIVGKSQYDSELAGKETLAIYGTNQLKRRRTEQANSADLLSKLPQNNFSVEDYAHSRVEIARRKVVEFEEKQLQSQQDPFSKLSRIALTQCSDKFTKRQVHREFQLVLQRSFIHLIRSIPELERNKLKVEVEAKENRNRRLQELRARREEQERKGEKDLLDLNELDQNHEDFFAMESSDDEQQPQEGSSYPEPQQEQQQQEGQEDNHEKSPAQGELVNEESQQEALDNEHEFEPVVVEKATPADVHSIVQERESVQEGPIQEESIQENQDNDDIPIEMSSDPPEDEEPNNSTYPV